MVSVFVVELDLCSIHYLVLASSVFRKEHTNFYYVHTGTKQNIQRQIGRYNLCNVLEQLLLLPTQVPQSKIPILHVSQNKFPFVECSAIAIPGSIYSDCVGALVVQLFYAYGVRVDYKFSAMTYICAKQYELLNLQDPPSKRQQVTATQPTQEESSSSEVSRTLFVGLLQYTCGSICMGLAALLRIVVCSENYLYNLCSYYQVTV